MVYRFGESENYGERCVLMYDGIHYDILAEEKGEQVRVRCYSRRKHFSSFPARYVIIIVIIIEIIIVIIVIAAIIVIIMSAKLYTLNLYSVFLRPCAR